MVVETSVEPRPDMIRDTPSIPNRPPRRPHPTRVRGDVRPGVARVVLEGVIGFGVAGLKSKSLRSLERV